jgi:hypothetical protein
MRKIVDLIEKLNANEVALYLDKYGILHASKSKDNAMKYAVGKIMITDEVGNDNGKPVFNGVAVDVYGAGEGYVYLSKYSREHDLRYLTATGTYKLPEGENGVTVHRKQLTKAEKEAYKLANEYYLAIKRA